MGNEEAVIEIEVGAAIQVLGEAVVKLERQYVERQRELLLVQGAIKRLQAQDQEKDAKITLLTRLLDSHELRIAALESKKPAAPHGGTFDA